jgi:TldD protein
VLFGMPRCSLSLRATSDGDGSRHGVSASVFDPRPDAPWNEATVSRLLARAERAARLARDLPGAPTHPAGSFPLVIDYALAKGLAHEAFGHAAEADGYRSSVLARDGRFRGGERVGADHVSIVDEPLEGDHAWQPFSANGLPRSRAVLVEMGRLYEGLSDPWSAGPGGVRLSGAARAESFHHAPLPRMSNIRLEVADPLPAPGEFEEYGPEEVRDLLGGAGIFRRHPAVVFLSGYAGGQVNTATGDFVFHCKAIYDLGPEHVRLHRPAIFSGSMFGALESVREGFGPLKLDAIGHCGKWGQSVPSSGGSHYFLLLEPHPTVRLGGS